MLSEPDRNVEQLTGPWSTPPEILFAFLSTDEAMEEPFHETDRIELTAKYWLGDRGEEEPCSPE